MAPTPVMAAALTFGMAISAGVATVVFALFLHAIAGRNDAQARVAGTFHLGDGGHGSLRFGF